jgi:hypothetical protein
MLNMFGKDFAEYFVAFTEYFVTFVEYSSYSANSGFPVVRFFFLWPLFNAYIFLRQCTMPILLACFAINK